MGKTVRIAPRHAKPRPFYSNEEPPDDRKSPGLAGGVASILAVVFFFAFLMGLWSLVDRIHVPAAFPFHF